MRGPALATAVMLGGCNLVLGLEPPAESDDAQVDASACNTHDEDGDSVPDGCDNCPHVANAEQVDELDGDGVGDACDPRPNEGGDRLIRFDAFDVAAADLIAIGVSVSGDQLIDPSAAIGANALGRVPVPADLRTLTIVTRARLLESMPTENGQSRSLGVWGIIDATSTNDPASPSGVVGEIGFEHGIIAANLMQIADTQSGAIVRAGAPPAFQVGLVADLTLTMGAAPFAHLTVVIAGVKHELAMDGGLWRTGDVGLRTHDVSASFDYLVVYGR